MFGGTGLARTSGPGKLNGLVLAVKGHDELRMSGEWREGER